jgi:transglutaminase-like putative cysteine protease/tetratricopeptide (TPR) repeat protein
MSLWRFRPHRRVLALLVLACAAARSAGAIASGSLVDESCERLRERQGRPEAIAPLAALVNQEDALPPGRLRQILGELVEGRLGGPPDPLVAAQAKYLLSLEEDRQGEVTAADERRRGLGLIGDFWIVGPFDAQGRSGLGRKFPVEPEEGSGAVPDPRTEKRWPGKERDVAWRRLPADAFVQGMVFVDAVLRPDSDAVAYLLTYVRSDRDRWAAMRVGTPGPVKAWVGGKAVLTNDVVRPAWLDQESVPVFLRRGTNPLVIKTVVTRGAWRVFARLTAADGTPLEGISVSADVPAKIAVGKAPREAPVVRDLGRLLQSNADGARGSAAAEGWLDEALFLSLVQPLDSESRPVEKATRKAIPDGDAALGKVAAQALVLLGQVAREEDERRAALTRALKAVSAADAQADLFADIGRLWRSQSRDDEAVVQWRKAVALDRDCVGAQLALAREEESSGMAASALARLLALPEKARSLSTVQDVLADMYATLGRRSEAEGVLRNLYRGRRSDVGVLRALAAAARRRGDLNETAYFFGEAQRWRPDLTGLVVEQAEALEGQGDVTAAREVVRKAIARLPDDAGLYEELGRLEARSGQNDAAVAAMHRSLELRPQNPTLRRYMQVLAETKNETKKAASNADDLVAEFAADGEALAREVLFGPPSSDSASAEVVLDRTAVRVHGNGLAERFVQRILHVRTDRAANDNQETWVRFEPGRQDVEIRKARILRRGAGQSLEISEATARDERGLSEPWYGLYYDTRAAVVVFENLRAGDVVEVQYTVADVAYSNDLADYFGDLDTIGDVFPVRHWDYTLIAPSTRIFYFNQPASSGIHSTTEERGAEKRYRFEAINLPRVESEPAMPGFTEIAPYLHISTYRGWEDMGRWYWNLVADQMKDDGSLAKAALQATAGLTSTLDKVKAIHRLVVENTRYVGLEFGIHGYKPYKSAQVLQRRFGDCKDKATLLVALLGKVGIEGELVLLRTRRGGRIDPMPASLAVFDHAIAYVPALSLYIDGTAEFSGLGELPSEDQDTMVLHVSAHGARLLRTPLLAAESNTASRTWQVELHADGSARVTEDVGVQGQAAHEWRSRYQTEGERRERYGKVWSGRFAGAGLDEVTMDVSDRNRPATVHATVNVPQFGELLPGGELRLPTSSREADFTSTYARLGKRHWPLVLAYPWRHEEQVRYRLPAGAHVVRAPSPCKVESPFGTFSLDVEAGDGTVAINSTLVVTQARIEPSSYPAFRSFLRDIDAVLAERMLVGLEQKP